MQLSKKPFSALRASVSSNNKQGGPGPPGASLDPPLISPHVSESKEFHAVDSGLKVLDSGPFVRETWIPDSKALIWGEGDRRAGSVPRNALC